MNKISIDWLNKKGACANSVAWFKAIFNKSASFKNLVLALIKDKELLLDDKFIWFCSVCTYTYISTKEEVITTCPRCASYNKKTLT